MALHSEFEALCGTILHHSPLSYVDSIVNELLTKEIHLNYQARKRFLSTPHIFVLAVPSRPPSNNKNKPYSKVSMGECNYYKQKGYWKAQCPEILNSTMQQQPSQRSP